MKINLFFGASALAFIGASMVAMPQVAFAQDADAGQQDSALNAFDEIVVTGTKTKDAENVQDVPLAITAFNAKSLDALNVRDVQSLTYSAPNVSLDQVGTSRGTANFSIRGLGINSSIPSIDPTVGVFVDGVYLGFNGGVVFDVFDLDSVEILRGPQGVLFGRNVTGGAVLINTGNPTDELSGKVRASIDGPMLDGGRGGNNYTTSAVISGPIVEDKLLVKVGGYYNKDEGYFRNLFDNSDHGKAETKIVRGAVEGRFGALNLLGKVDYFKSDGDGPSAQNHAIYGRDTFNFSINNRGSYDNEIVTTSLKAELEVGPGTLTNVFGYRSYDATTDGDIDSSPLTLYHSGTKTSQEQYSNELRYAMSGDNYDLTFGGFYFDQSIAYDENRNLPTLSAAKFYGGGKQDHEVLGLFVNTKYNLTDALSVIAGVRWSRETKDASVTYIRPRPACSIVDGTCTQTGKNPYVPSENNGFSDGNTWKNVSPKLGLQYEYDQGQFYAHWTRGYRSGGYNFRITNAKVFETVVVPATGGNFSFDEEKVDNYEFGGKFQTDDRSFTLNAATYVTQIKNMQREVNQSSPTAGVSQFILNTADATIWGAEAEARMRVSPSLVFTSNIGIIDANYDSVRFDISGDNQINDVDKALQLPRVPKATWGVGAVHEIDLGKGSIVSRVNFQYRDKIAYTDSNFGWVPSAENLDANITWNTPIEGLSLSLYGKNLLDDVQFGGDTQLPFPGPLSDGNNRPFDPRPAAGTLSPLSKGRQIGFEAVFSF